MVTILEHYILAKYDTGLLNSSNKQLSKWEKKKKNVECEPIKKIVHCWVDHFVSKEIFYLFQWGFQLVVQIMFMFRVFYSYKNCTLTKEAKNSLWKIARCSVLKIPSYLCKCCHTTDSGSPWLWKTVYRSWYSDNLLVFENILENNEYFLREREREREWLHEWEG